MTPTPAEFDSTGTPPPPEATPAPEKKRRSRLGVSAAGVLSVLAIVAALGAWYDMRRQLERTREQVARQVHDNGAEARDARLIAREAQEALREVQAKVGALDAKLAESQTQQLTLESLYQDLSRNRDDWVLAEIEQVLTIASQQLQLAGNVQAALIALQSADARLARSDRPQFLTIRKAIARDIEKLRVAPNLDVTGLTLRLDQVIAKLNDLPLLVDGRTEEEAQRAAAVQTVAAEPWWRRWPRGAWNEIKQLVRVQRLDAVDQKLLSPEQRYFARENLRLRLLHARVALLQRDERAFKADVQASLEQLRTYFDSRERDVFAAVATLAQLNNAAISVELPTIADSLNAVHSAKLPREKLR